MKREAVACEMLHSVGVPDPSWVWRHLTLPAELFAGQLKLLRRLGYRSVSLPEYRDLSRTGGLSQHRVICLTFDDGYLDNWVYAAPLLKQYGFTATVFVSTDFVDPADTPRPQWNPENPEAHPPSSGFLNRGELRRLEAEGIMDVQSHAATHTWYPCGPRIVDFRRPGDEYPWMDWNRNPADKWRSLTPRPREAGWGEPVYEHCKALEGPRHHPDERVAEGLRLYAAEQGTGFFDRPDWREMLQKRAEALQREFPGGDRETHEAFLVRTEKELVGSAAYFGTLLDKTVRYLCWPGGGYTPEVFDLAARHYAGTTISSRDMSAAGGVDALGCFRFRRFGPLHAGSREKFRYLGSLPNALYLEELRTGNLPARLARGAFTRLAQWRSA